MCHLNELKGTCIIRCICAGSKSGLYTQINIYLKGKLDRKFSRWIWLQRISFCEICSTIQYYRGIETAQNPVWIRKSEKYGFPQKFQAWSPIERTIKMILNCLCKWTHENSELWQQEFVWLRQFEVSHAHHMPSPQASVKSIASWAVNCCIYKPWGYTSS